MTKKRTNGFTWPPDKAQICAWIFIIYFGLVTFGTFCPSMSMPYSYSFAILFAFLYLTHILLNIIVMAINPGEEATLKRKIVPSNNFDREKHQHVIENQFCNICQIVVSLKAKHCKRCNKCITSFDHHCIYLNNCIGGRNYKSFILTVTSAFVGTLVISIIGTIEFSYSFFNDQKFLTNRFYEKNTTLCNEDLCDDKYKWLPIMFAPSPINVWRAIMAITIALATISFILTGYLLGYHVFLKIKNISTYEHSVILKLKETQKKSNSTSSKETNSKSKNSIKTSSNEISSTFNANNNNTGTGNGIVIANNKKNNSIKTQDLSGESSAEPPTRNSLKTNLNNNDNDNYYQYNTKNERLDNGTTKKNGESNENDKNLKSSINKFNETQLINNTHLINNTQIESNLDYYYYNNDTNLNINDTSYRPNENIGLKNLNLFTAKSSLNQNNQSNINTISGLTCIKSGIKSNYLAIDNDNETLYASTSPSEHNYDQTYTNYYNQKDYSNINNNNNNQEIMAKPKSNLNHMKRLPPLQPMNNLRENLNASNNSNSSTTSSGGKRPRRMRSRPNNETSTTSASSSSSAYKNDIRTQQSNDARSNEKSLVKYTEPIKISNEDENANNYNNSSETNVKNEISKMRSDRLISSSGKAKSNYYSSRISKTMNDHVNSSNDHYNNVNDDDDDDDDDDDNNEDGVIINPVRIYDRYNNNSKFIKT